MKHADDDGDLSIFAGSGDELLVVCNKGHHWVVQATRVTHASRDSFDVGRDYVAEHFGAEAAGMLAADGF